MDIKIDEIKPIEYPLDNIAHLIRNDKINCNNKKKLDYSNIEIIYDTETKDNTIYRCPVCLCIPFLYYTMEKIVYSCNCGIFYCSLDYFFTNFKSYPITEIIFKEKSETEGEMAFCSSCVKFINNVSKHRREYFGHIIKNTNHIFLNSKKGNFNEFIFPENKKVFYEGINQVNLNAKNEEKEPEATLNFWKEIVKVFFNSFISKYLNFDIISTIEKTYEKFLMEFNKGKEKSQKSNSEIKVAEEMNSKLFLFSKLIYYVFQKNLSKNTLNFQIIVNIFYVINNLYKFESKKEIDILSNYFINNFSAFKKIYQNKKYSEAIYLKSGFSHHQKFFYYRKVFYDSVSKRNIIVSPFELLFFVTGKNSDYSQIFVKSNEKRLAGINILYFDKLKKNILAFKEIICVLEKKEENILFLDIDSGKILYRLILPKRIITPCIMKDIEIIDDKYLIINIKGFDETFFYCPIIEQRILIYSLIYEKEMNSFKFEFLFECFDSTKNKTFIKMYKIMNLLALAEEKEILFYKINGREARLEEYFTIKLIKNEKYNIDIGDIKNSKFVVKYIHVDDYNKKRSKFEIYDIKLKQKISSVKCDIFDDIFFFGKFLLTIRKDFILYNQRTLKEIRRVKNNNYEKKRKGIIFKDAHNEWNLIYENCWFKIVNENLKVFQFMTFNDFNEGLIKKDFTFCSSEEFIEKTNSSEIGRCLNNIYSMVLLGKI